MKIRRDSLNLIFEINIDKFLFIWFEFNTQMLVHLFYFNLILTLNLYYFDLLYLKQNYTNMSFL